MKKVILTVGVIFALLTSVVFSYGADSVTSGGSEFPKIEAMTQSEDWFDPSNGKYMFPITPDSPEWKNFQTHNEMVEACTIPEDLLKSISTKDLIQLVLDYPLLNEFRCFNSYEEGLEVLKTNFNGLQELLRRKDGATGLVNAYCSIPVTKASTIPQEVANEVNAAEFSDKKFTSILNQLKETNRAEYNSFYKGIADVNKTQFIELLLSSEAISLSSSELKTYENNFNLKEKLRSKTSLYKNSANQTRATITLKTPSGKVVPTSLYAVDNPEFSSAQIAQITADYKRTYPNATVLRNASNVYNCHSYAWYKQSLPNRVWLNDCGTYRFDTNSYKVVTVPKGGDKIFYAASLGGHSGIVATAGSTAATSTIKSKWGQGPLMQHKTLYVPSNYTAGTTLFRLR
ncbi:Uncharacterised protein [uncultured Eubacterium sp.]|nr:Uncharacterised protein [uncultured Eubacterium sp.]